MSAGINKPVKKTARTQRKRLTFANDQPIELPEGMWERIRKKAHELWLERGRRTGQALQGWLEAEAIVMEEIHEARE
jgi:hypothetical protein